MITLTIALLLGLEASPMCLSSDVKTMCCPSACAAKNSPKWSTANDVLRNCAKSIGCKDWVSSVGMTCDCAKGGAS